jgi:tyrosyl-tRNA synthetase
MFTGVIIVSICFFLFYYFLSKIFNNGTLKHLNRRTFKYKINESEIIQISFQISMQGYDFKIIKKIKGDKNNHDEQVDSEGICSTKEEDVNGTIILNYKKPYDEFLDFHKLNFVDNKLYWKNKEFIEVF